MRVYKILKVEMVVRSEVAFLEGVYQCTMLPQEKKI